MTKKENIEQVIDDIDIWPDLLGYEVSESASIDEKIALRLQHAQHLVSSLDVVRSKAFTVNEFLATIIKILARLNEKTEARVCDIHSMLSQLKINISNENPAEENIKSLDSVVAALQFYDIQRQEVEGIVSSLEEIKAFFGSHTDYQNLSELLVMLPDILSALSPRDDIDALDVENAGAPIELF